MHTGTMIDQPSLYFQFNKQAGRWNLSLLPVILALIAVMLFFAFRSTNLNRKQNILLDELQFDLPGGWMPTSIRSGIPDSLNVSPAFHRTIHQLYTQFSPAAEIEWAAVYEQGGQSAMLFALNYQQHHIRDARAFAQLYAHFVAGDTKISSSSASLEVELYPLVDNDIEGRMWLIGVDGQYAHYLFLYIGSLDSPDFQESTFESLLASLREIPAS